MQVHTGIVLVVCRVRKVGLALVNGQNMLGWQVVGKRELDRSISLRHDDAAEMSGPRRVGAGPALSVPPQSGRIRQLRV